MVNRMVPTTDPRPVNSGGPELFPPIASYEPDEPPALPEGFVCPDGMVPGWLNSGGMPTSCVGDEPLVPFMPELFPPALPLDGARELAATGSDLADLLFNSGTLTVAVAMIVVGFAFYWMDKNKWDRSE